MEAGIADQWKKLSLCCLDFRAAVDQLPTLSGYMFTREQKQKRRRADVGLAAFFAAVFLTGSVMFIGIAVFPQADLPAYSRWLIRIASFILGGVFLILFSFFMMQIRFFLTGKRKFTIRLGKRDSHK